MTNYELLRSLVEMLSHDIHHYRMVNVSAVDRCDIFNLSSSYLNVILTTMHHLYSVVESEDSRFINAVVKESCSRCCWLFNLQLSRTLHM